jgi:hypothetical protein
VHKLLTQDFDFGVNRHFAPGEPVVLRAPLALPRDVPSTFIAAANEVRSIVRVHARIRGWPDLIKDIPVTVVPQAQDERRAAAGSAVRQTT